MLNASGTPASLSLRAYFSVSNAIAAIVPLPDAACMPAELPTASPSVANRQIQGWPLPESEGKKPIAQGHRQKLWGSMVKQAIKRRRPGFNERFYGISISSKAASW